MSIIVSDVETLALSIDADRAGDVSRIAGEYFYQRSRIVIANSGGCTIALARTEAASALEAAV